MKSRHTHAHTETLAHTHGEEEMERCDGEQKREPERTEGERDVDETDGMREGGGGGGGDRTVTYNEGGASLISLSLCLSLSHPLSLCGAFTPLVASLCAFLTHQF